MIFKDENPLSIPMLFGWSREVVKRGDEELPIVIYCSPCGRRLRNMAEVHQYLCLTGSQLGVDFYSFESCVHCFNEFEPEIIKNYIEGIFYFFNFVLFFRRSFVYYTALNRLHKRGRKRSSICCQLC